MPASPGSSLSPSPGQLAERLDRAIALASKDEWDRLDEEAEQLFECLDEIRNTDFVALVNGSSHFSADSAAEYLSVALEKIERLSRLLQPRHAELAQLLVKQVNSRKLSETYRA